MRRSSLFHAVVVAGAAITQGGCYESVLRRADTPTASADASIRDSGRDTAGACVPCFAPQTPMPGCRCDEMPIIL